MMDKQAHSDLEQLLFDSVDSKTPDYIKNNPLVNLENKGELVFRLKKEHLEPYSEENPQGLNLNEWFKNYAKEAAVSTAGIRGPQNVLYPHDTRFPINLIGIMLATEAKAIVAKKMNPDSELIKLAGCEVRYNSQLFLEAIARVQAAHGIKTLVPKDRKTIPIWMASFLAFKLDLLGGEYITSSHGISVKNATKDLNSQGSQYLPEESMLFVNEIKNIFEQVENNGYYDIKIAANDNPLISQELMTKLDDGVKLYKQYLLDGVAKDANLNLIKKFGGKIVIENVGGSAYNTLSRILKSLDIDSKFVWMNKEEDPFFHGIGKYDTDPKGNKTFYDYSVDATVIAKDKDGKPYFPVINSLHYDEKLKEFKSGTVVLITDPDHDRLTVCQVESADKKDFLKSLGVDFVELGDGRILTVFTANQSFLMIMDFWAENLKKEGLFDKHPRFIIKTTASARSWDEWAAKNSIKVVNVPVGFKEIANIMKKVEKQITENPDRDVIVTDVLGNDIDLGVNPKLIFGGEESGGMIIGSEELIVSQAGRKAIAMREKSATEAIIVASALTSYLEKENITMSEYLNDVFNKNQIISKFDIREDISYYNESEPDIEKLKQAKIAGEAQRTKNDIFYLTMAVAKKQGKMSLDSIREILADTFKELDFSNLKDVKFVGDGTYLEFDDKFIEIRPSGTDAKTKAYGAGASKDEIKKFAQIMGNYSGDLTDLYKKYVDMNLYENAKELSLEDYAIFTNKDANNAKFEIPDYSKTLQFKSELRESKMKYDICKTFKFVKNDKKWLKKLFTGYGILLLFVLFFVAPVLAYSITNKLIIPLFLFCWPVALLLILLINGFSLQAAHDYIDNPLTELPSWSNYKSLLFVGFKAALGLVLLYLPFVIFSIIVFVLFPPTRENTVISYSVKLLYNIVNLFYTIIVYAFSANFIREFNVLDYTNYVKAYRMLKGNMLNYAILVLLALSIGVVFNVASALLSLTVIGVIFVPLIAFYIQIVTSILTARFVQITREHKNESKC